MSQLYISRSHVRKSLASAATARAWIILGAPFVVMALIGIMFPATFRNPWVIGATFIVVPLLASWIATTLLCRRAVMCPACEGSLWDIGNGSFLPGRMKIKDDATSCPNCSAVLI
jgi:hypothetical protein